MRYIRHISFSVVILSLFYLICGLLFEADIFKNSISWITGDFKREEANIKETVRFYNKIFTDISVSAGKPFTLDVFPSSKHIKHELFKNKAFLMGKNLIIVYDMADLKFVDVKRTSFASAEVTTFEEWNYVYQEADSRFPVKPIKGMGQGFKYYMQRHKGEWIVVDYAPVDVSFERNEEFLF